MGNDFIRTNDSAILDRGLPIAQIRTQHQSIQFTGFCLSGNKHFKAGRFVLARSVKTAGQQEQRMQLIKRR